MKLLVLFVLIILVFFGFIYYYTNNVYDFLGKTSWHYEFDGDKGKSLVETNFLQTKLPTNVKNLKYKIDGYCGFDCYAVISFDTDEIYFNNLTKDKILLKNSKNKPLMYENDSNFWQKLKSEIVTTPNNLEQIFIDKTESDYPAFYWYQNGQLNYYRLVQ